MRLATYASVSVAVILIAAKLVAWLMTDSVSLLSTLLDSVLDALASLINLFAVRHALTPPDREHRFGHGKAEPLAALAQSAFIAGSALFLFIEAGHRFYRPRAVEHVDLGIAVMVFAILLTFVLTRYQAYVVKQTRSMAIKADSLHYVGDMLVNAAVIVALLLVSEFGWAYADPIFGVCIAIYIIYNAWRIVKIALNSLMDHELPESERQKIREIVLAHSDVLGLHDLRTRTAGPRTFIQMHLEVDGAMSLNRAHEIADAVEADLYKVFPDSEVIIHQDPYGLEEPPRR